MARGIIAFLLCAASGIAASPTSQTSTTDVPTGQKLVEVITELDAKTSAAYSTCDLNAMASLLAPDVELYNDETARIVGRDSVIDMLRKNLYGGLRSEGVKYRRELVAGSLEVFPIARRRGSCRLCRRRFGTAHAQLTTRRAQHAHPKQGPADPIAGTRTLDVAPRHLLTGLGRCAVCGGGWLAHTRDHGSKREVLRLRDSLEAWARVCANGLLARVDAIDAEVIATLADDVLRPPVIERAIGLALEELAPVDQIDSTRLSGPWFRDQNCQLITGSPQVRILETEDVWAARLAVARRWSSLIVVPDPDLNPDF